MPEIETGKKIDEMSSRRYQALQEVVKVARGVLPALKDHHLNHSAAELAEKLFQLDAIEQEMRDVVLADPRGAIDAFLQRMTKRSS